MGVAVSKALPVLPAMGVAVSKALPVLPAMGVAASVVLPTIGVAVPVAGIVALIVAYALLSRVFPCPDGESPTLGGISALHQANQAQRQAEQAAREAQELAYQIQQQADRDREKAQLREEEARQAVAQATEEAEKMKEQLKEAANAARRAQELADEASRAAREEVERITQDAREERERGQKLKEGAEQAMEAARQDAERAQMAADEQRREAEAVKSLAEEVARAAAGETRKAIEAKEEAERRWREGIQPVATPSFEEVTATKRRVEYREDCFHFAVAGISGSGKSSLVNAFRGLRSRDPGAAAVGVTETTLQMTRYPDANPNNPFVWYDIPGAGTLKCRDWQYFNEQGLYVFDCIIVLFDNRFTITDIAILVNARRFNIPTYIVRSKADQHIRNVMKENGYDSEGDRGDTERYDRSYKAARKQFIEETRKSVRTNLGGANLPDQRVYIISSDTMLRIVLDKMPKKTIDEVVLINDLLNEAYSRRLTKVDGATSVSADSRANK